MRNIKNGKFGWYEKGAMEKIDKLPFKKQASCKLIYIAICSVSAKNKNSNEVECYKFDIARFASVSEKTVQRYLPDLEELGIIKVAPQDRMSNGKFEKVRIWLNNNNSTDGQMEDSSETDERQMEDTESDIYKEINKERKKEIDKGDKSPRSKFTPPSIADVEDYFTEAGYPLEADKFYNFYESKNWYVGPNKMKKWKSSASGWLSRSYPGWNNKLKSITADELRERVASGKVKHQELFSFFKDIRKQDAPYTNCMKWLIKCGREEDAKFYEEGARNEEKDKTEKKLKELNNQYNG